MTGTGGGAPAPDGGRAGERREGRDGRDGGPGGRSGSGGYGGNAGHGPDRTAKVRLHGMRFFGRIGHTEEERVVGTHVEVDVELTIPLAEGPVHALSRTVDYREVHDLCRGVVEAGDHPLLEGLCEEVLDVLEELEWVHALVRVRKRSPPITGTVAFAEVELDRHRPHGSG